MKTSNMSKLSFYRKYKSDHNRARYNTPVDNRRHRSALAKLKLVDILKFITNIPLRTNNYQEKKDL